jgi:hypothetical protein
MFSRSTRNGGIATREKLQVIQIRTTQAERASLLIECDHGSREQILSAFAAFSIPANEERKDLAGLLLGRDRLHVCIVVELDSPSKGPWPKSAL